MSEDSTSSILRGVRCLIGLAELAKPVAFGVLADSLQLPASTTHRILGVLRQAGYIYQDPDTGSYALGPAFLRMSTTFCASTHYPKFLQMGLQQLTSATGETSFYGGYLAATQRFRFISIHYSEHAVQFMPRLDKTYSMLWGGSGRSIFAFLPEPMRREIYNRECASSEGISQLPPWDAFEREMEEIRLAGYCSTSSHRFQDVNSIAAPVFGLNKTLLGCLGVSVPAERYESRKAREHAKLVIRAADELSKAAQCMIDLELEAMLKDRNAL